MKVRRGTIPGKIEVGLIGLERIRTRPSVQALVLMVACSRHPGTVPGGARVVMPIGSFGTETYAVRRLEPPSAAAGVLRVGRVGPSASRLSTGAYVSGPSLERSYERSLKSGVTRMLEIRDVD